MFGRKRRLTLGSGWNFAASVLASIVAAIILAVGAIVLAALATWLKGISDLSRGVLWGAALGFILHLTVFTGLWLYWQLKAKGKGWESGIYADGPRVTLPKTNGFYTKQVGWYYRDPRYFETDILSMTISNLGKEDAKDLQVKFRCEGPKVNLRRWLIARLDTSKQPHNLLPGEELELVFNLESGKARDVSLVVKEPQLNNCFLFNNESYDYPRVQNPAWEMGPGKYKILVEIIGLHVVERFECTFRNRGQGSLLEIKSFRAIKLFSLL